MSAHSAAFILTTFYPAHFQVPLRSSSFSQSACEPSKLRKRSRPAIAAPLSPPLFPVMRMHRRYGSSRRPSSTPSFEKLTRSAQSLWLNASGAERLTIAATALAAVAVAGVVVNVLFHVSLMLAFSVIPLLLAPIILTIMASLTAFAVLTFATAGAGFFFIGTPFFAVALFAKALLPVLLIFGGVSVVMGRVLGFKEKSDVEDVVEDADDMDDFEKFDRTLRDRQREKGWDVTRWGLSEVVDELDFTGLGEYRQLFIQERIDGSTLLELTDEDIKNEFGRAMPLGDRMRLGRLVTALRKRSTRLP